MELLSRKFRVLANTFTIGAVAFIALSFGILNFHYRIKRRIDRLGDL